MNPAVTGPGKTIVNPDTLAPPTGSPDTPYYSWVCQRGGLIFLSGMSPYTQDKKLVQGDLQAHTRQAFSNMRSALESVGASMADVCSITVYVSETDLQTHVYPEINPVCLEFFGASPPARAVVGGVALPRPTERVMISGIACLG